MQPELPEWIVKLQVNSLFTENFYPYLAGSTFQSNIVTAGFEELISGAVAPKAAKHTEVLKLDPMLFDAPTSQGVLDRLLSTDVGRPVDATFKDLYVLVRSSALIVDMNTADFGDTAQAVLYAYLLDIPIFGIGYYTANSPWTMGKLVSFVTPQTTDDIVLAVRGYLDSLDTIRRARLDIIEKVPDDDEEAPSESEDG
jgi:hypothetical protein